MDRREALKKMAVSGATVVGTSAVVSGVAFADGGSRVNCRPTPATASSLTPSVSGSGKNYISITPTVATFSALACPEACSTGTGTVQYRYELTTATAGVALFTASSGGSVVSSAFSSAAGSITVPQVFIRNTGGGNLSTPSTYTVRLTVRYVCTVGTKKYWSCRAYTVVVSYVSGTGANGDISATPPVNSTTGPPDNSASCDSPAP